MKSALEINGKSLASIKDAAGATSYSRDYITRLAREEKIVASYIGRQWFVDIDSLQCYAEHIAREQAVRQRILSKERKREQELQALLQQRRTTETYRAQRIPVRSAVASLLILGAGLATGTFMHNTTSVYISLQALSLFSQPVTPAPTVPVATGKSAPTGSAVITRTSLVEDASRVAVATKQSLGVATEGVLLLPTAGAVPNVTELFSDAVAVRESADGSRTVTLIDEQGNQIGNPVPFVVVPVNEREL